VIVDDTIHAEPYAYDLKTGKRKTRVHPITGETNDWLHVRYGTPCGTVSASKNFLMGDAMSFSYFDLEKNVGLSSFKCLYAGCWISCVSGDGMMYLVPQSEGRDTRAGRSTMPYLVAIGPVDKSPAPALTASLEPKISTPVKHLNINYGDAGDRKAPDGSLWMGVVPRNRYKYIQWVNHKTSFYEGGGFDSLRSSAFTPIANTDIPFVFTSAGLGLKQSVIPLLNKDDGKSGVFSVRLGFAAPPGDVAGQRVFAIKLQGKTVLEGFDIVKEAGGPDKAVWKEFKHIESDGDLTLELVASKTEPAVNELPLVNGISILREDGKVTAAPKQDSRREK
jgi:hypothetical protein